MTPCASAEVDRGLFEPPRSRALPLTQGGEGAIFLTPSALTKPVSLRPCPVPGPAPVSSPWRPPAARAATPPCPGPERARAGQLLPSPAVGGPGDDEEP